MDNVTFGCDHEGCDSTETELYQYDEVTHEFLCDEHAKMVGFCLGCTQFCAGQESYDFSQIPGYCYECVQNIHAEFDEDYGLDEDDEYDYEEDYY